MRIESVNGKKILFFSPEFFAIDKNIIRVLEENGARVTWYDERSVRTSFARAINSICPYVFNIYSNNYYQKIFDQIDFSIDVLLVIKGDMISKKIITSIRKRFPNTELILYLYDPVKNVKGIINKLDLYDRVISFDKADCDNYGFEFRPLFCSIEREKPNDIIEYQNDICFYGTMYGDRFSIVEKVRSFCRDNNIRFYSFCFLRGKFMALYYYLLNPGFKKLGIESVSFKPKSTEEIANIVYSSKAILDVNDINQNGLTNRTLETLISGRKLITTNAAIKEYDLYNENNVYIIDRNDVSIEKAFLDVEPVRLPKSITDKYTAEGWVRDVFK